MAEQAEGMTIHPEMKDPFRQFSRNGRWGDCAACPRDTNRHAYPEFCQFTDRGDHQLDVRSLADAHLVKLGRLKK